jgi:hypothetical protein
MQRVMNFRRECGARALDGFCTVGESVIRASMEAASSTCKYEEASKLTAHDDMILGTLERTNEDL